MVEDLDYVPIGLICIQNEPDTGLKWSGFVYNCVLTTPIISINNVLFQIFDKTRPFTRLPKSRAGGLGQRQNIWAGAVLGKTPKNPEKSKV